MNPTVYIVSILCGLSVTQAAFPNVFNFEIPQWAEKEVKNTRFSDAINKLITHYHVPQAGKQQLNIVDLLMNGGTLPKRVNGFTWKDCGGNAGSITKLDLSPDPIQFPGVITVSAAFALNTTLGAPLQMSVVWERKVGDQYIEFPCIGNIGSCIYDDVCSMLADVQCPDPLVQYGIPCQCPFAQNNYNLPPVSFEIDAEFLPAGDYHIKAVVSSGGKHAVCLDLYASVAFGF